MEKNQNNNSFFIDKVYKFTTKENREIIGMLKAYNKQGHFYLIDCVEVMNKKGEHFASNELFENTDEHKFYYDSDNYQYQYINNCVFPIEEIGQIYMLKDELFNKYELMLTNYYEEKQTKEENQKIEKEKQTIENNQNKKEEDSNKEKENIDELLDTIQKDDKKKKKKKKKKNNK